jgi:hypothetical protein
MIVLYRAVAIGVCVACDPPWKRKITEKFKKVNELESLWKMVCTENFLPPPAPTILGKKD